jgi:hypothetical protein
MWPGPTAFFHQRSLVRAVATTGIDRDVSIFVQASPLPDAT